MTVTEIDGGTGDAQLDDLLAMADAALRSAFGHGGCGVAQRRRLDNRDLVSARLWTLLVDRIVKEWRMSRPLAERVMDQALGYLRLCAAEPEVTFSPSPLVDIGWHVFILHTKAYADFCDQLAGRFIHHTPYNDDEVNTAAADCGPCGPCHANERGLEVGVNNIARTVAALRRLGVTVDEPLWFAPGVRDGGLS
jgi:hypothetical protein